MIASICKPVFGTGLTWIGGLAILAVGPAFWAVFDLVLVVTP